MELSFLKVLGFLGILFMLSGCDYVFKYQSGACIQNMTQSELESFWHGKFARVEGVGSVNGVLPEGYVLRILDYSQESLVWEKDWVEINTVEVSSSNCVD